MDTQAQGQYGQVCQGHSFPKIAQNIHMVDMSQCGKIPLPKCPSAVTALSQNVPGAEINILVPECAQHRNIPVQKFFLRLNVHKDENEMSICWNVHS